MSYSFHTSNSPHTIYYYLPCHVHLISPPGHLWGPRACTTAPHHRIYCRPQPTAHGPPRPLLPDLSSQGATGKQPANAPRFPVRFITSRPHPPPLIGLVRQIVQEYHNGGFFHQQAFEQGMFVFCIDLGVATTFAWFDFADEVICFMQELIKV